MKFLETLKVTAVASLFGIVAVSAPAQADELRAGIVLHDGEFFEDLIFGGKHGKEQSVAITAEYIWETPDWLEWAWGARPYIGGTANLEGETSHGGAGVVWRGEFWDNFYADFALGLVVHSGHVRTPNPIDATTPEEVAIRHARKASEIEFGSRVLFRENIALGYRFTEEWAGEIMYEHLSHGQILGGPENEGANTVGVRLSRRF